LILGSISTIHAKKVSPFEKALQLINQKQLDQAEALFRKIVKNDPSNLSAWLNLGHLLKRKGKNKEAIAAYSKVVFAKGDIKYLGKLYLIPALASYGSENSAKQHLNDLKQSENDLTPSTRRQIRNLDRQIFGIDRGPESKLYQRALKLMNKSKYKLAKKNVKKLLKHDSSGEGRTLSALVYYAQGLKKQAMEELEEALQRKFDNKNRRVTAERLFRKIRSELAKDFTWSLGFIFNRATTQSSSGKDNKHTSSFNNYLEYNLIDEQKYELSIINTINWTHTYRNFLSEVYSGGLELPYLYKLNSKNFLEITPSITYIYNHYKPYFLGWGALATYTHLRNTWRYDFDLIYNGSDPLQSSLNFLRGDSQVVSARASHFFSIFLIRASLFYGIDNYNDLIVSTTERIPINNNRIGLNLDAIISINKKLSVNIKQGYQVKTFDQPSLPENVNREDKILTSQLALSFNPHRPIGSFNYILGVRYSKNDSNLDATTIHDQSSETLKFFGGLNWNIVP
jgi:tetratricopeptide (TPR) repeat protein